MEWRRETGLNQTSYRRENIFWKKKKTILFGLRIWICFLFAKAGRSQTLSCFLHRKRRQIMWRKTGLRSGNGSVSHSCKKKQVGCSLWMISGLKKSVSLVLHKTGVQCWYQSCVLFAGKTQWIPNCLENIQMKPKEKGLQVICMKISVHSLCEDCWILEQREMDAFSFYCSQTGLVKKKSHTNSSSCQERFIRL